jgi:cytochrome c oxidase cbb3-type subunit 3
MKSDNQLNKQEQNLLLNHDYDGIQEFNYPLPFWWRATFYGGIIFGVLYIIYFIFMNGPSLKHEYFVDQKEVFKVREEYLAKLKEFKPETYNAIVGSEEMKHYGEEIFVNNCLSCHREKAAGDIGPNLTDDYWLLSNGTAQEIYPFIIEGNPVNGMPGWGGVLAEEDLYAVTAYITSLRGTSQENPKEPQGDLYSVDGTQPATREEVKPEESAK